MERFINRLYGYAFSDLKLVCRHCSRADRHLINISWHRVSGLRKSGVIIERKD